MTRLLGIAVTASTFLAAELSSQEQIGVVTEPGTPVVVTELLLTVGPSDEAAADAGVAHLAARSVIAPIQSVLDSLGVRVAVLPQKEALSISVIAAPDVWDVATERILRAVFQTPPDSVSTIRQRQTIVAELRGRQANPADAATREADRYFFGAAHPWGRSTVGTPETVGSLSFADVRAFVRENFTRTRARVAVLGPVDEDSARDHLRPLLGAGAPAPVEVEPYVSALSSVRRDYNSVTTWVSASFRFPEDADEEAIRFIGFLAGEELSFSPSQRSVYNVSTSVVPRVGSGELRLQVVVPPEQARDWAERVESIVPGLLARSMPPDVFAARLRRYHGDRLMSLLAPEDRAHAAARQLLVKGEVGVLVPDPASLTQDRIREAARSLARPTIVLLGPTPEN
jgi:predicted Zn-dependent peptidase